MRETPDPLVRNGYEYCRRLHRRRDPTYYWATKRLREDLRPAVHALYAFARVVDDQVDGPRRATALGRAGRRSTTTSAASTRPSRASRRAIRCSPRWPTAAAGTTCL